MTQNEWIFKRMKKSKKLLTTMEALNGCGCLRLAARINELKNQGHKIKKYWVQKGEKKFAGYMLMM